MQILISSFIFAARYSTHSLAAPLDEFDCAHWLTNIPLLLLLLKSPFFPAFSRKVPCHKFTPCSFSLSFAGKILLIFALHITRQITLFLCFTLYPLKCSSRLKSKVFIFVSSLYFVLCKLQAFDWASKAAYIYAK